MVLPFSIANPSLLPLAWCDKEEGKAHILKTQILNCQNYFLQENRFISLQQAGSTPHIPLASASAHAGAYPMLLRNAGTLACSSGPLSDFEKWIIDYNSRGLSADLSGECRKGRAQENVGPSGQHVNCPHSLSSLENRILSTTPFNPSVHNQCTL